MPPGDDFHCELFRWKRHCNGISGEKSVISLLCEDADPIFFPNVRQLLCILAISPIGSTEAERSFSCLRQVHSWLRTTMSDGRLGNLGVLALHGFDFELNTQTICENFIKNTLEKCVNHYCYLRTRASFIICGVFIILI